MTTVATILILQLPLCWVLLIFATEFHVVNAPKFKWSWRKPKWKWLNKLFRKKASSEKTDPKSTTDSSKTEGVKKNPVPGPMTKRTEDPYGGLSQRPDNNPHFNIPPSETDNKINTLELPDKNVEQQKMLKVLDLKSTKINGVLSPHMEIDKNGALFGIPFAASLEFAMLDKHGLEKVQEFWKKLQVAVPPLHFKYAIKDVCKEDDKKQTVENGDVKMAKRKSPAASGPNGRCRIMCYTMNDAHSHYLLGSLGRLEWEVDTFNEKCHIRRRVSFDPHLDSTDNKKVTGIVSQDKSSPKPNRIETLKKLVVAFEGTTNRGNCEEGTGKCRCFLEYRLKVNDHFQDIFDHKNSWIPFEQSSTASASGKDSPKRPTQPNVNPIDGQSQNHKKLNNQSAMNSISLCLVPPILQQSDRTIAQWRAFITANVILTNPTHPYLVWMKTIMKT